MRHTGTVIVHVFQKKIWEFTTLIWGRAGLVVRASDSGARGRGFDPHSGRRVVSLSNLHLLPKSTDNTQEVMAPSEHD